MKRFLLLSLVVLLAGCGLGVQDNLWTPPSPQHEVSIRQIPAMQTIQAELNGSLGNRWSKGLRMDTKYLSRVESPLRYPIMITVPGWQEATPSAGGLFEVEMKLMDQAQLPNPKSEGLSIVNYAALTVACYSWQGAYTLDNYTKAWTQIMAYLAQRDIRVSGPPRILLYSNPDLTPEPFCVGEMQIPVPDKISAD